MSNNAPKSSSQGRCNAIFSKSPIIFDKENQTPTNKKKSGDSSQNQQPTHKFNHPQNSLSTTFKHGRKNQPTLQSPDRQKSTIQNKISESCVNLSDENCHRTPKMGSKTKPQQSSHTKVNLLSTPRTPVKQYFSDYTALQATPDCFNSVQVETPSSNVNEEQTVSEGENSNLTVGVRVRPMNVKESQEANVASIIRIDGQNIIVDSEPMQYKFTYDHCFISYADPSIPGHSSQEDVFKTMVLPLVQTAFEGYNVCLLAYGQTGSGKSFSMMGKDNPDDNGEGIIPRFCKEVFAKMSEIPHMVTTAEISYFEIYNEKIHDLLMSSSSSGKSLKSAPLKVREHPVFGPYIVDLSQHSVQNYQDLQSWLQVGNSHKVTAATGMNEKSSRSHSIFSIVLTQESKSDSESTDKSNAPSRRSKINLVDLAGSERLSQTNASVDRLREGVSINKSLLTLGKVIVSLAGSTNNRRRGFVPYRESVLTWLLKESLGGNSRTAMLATVSPTNIHLDETLATLRYACQARTIINRIRINENSDKLIRELLAEVQRLRGIQESYEKQLPIGHPQRLLDRMESHTTEKIEQKQKEINRLRDQLKKTEDQLAISQKSSLEKLREAEQKKNSELSYLKRCGIAVEIDLRETHKQQPCLVNLAADPMLSGTLLYLLPPGFVRIGRDCESRTPSKKKPDIVLDGPLVKQLHCTIKNDGGKLILTPEMEGDTYVNGQMVTGTVYLKHGDRLVIGGNHYFKVSNPNEETDGTLACSKSVIDFEFAHQEILKIQEQKLRSELEEAKRKAIKELENAKKEVESQLGSQKSNYEREIEALGTTLEEQKLAFEEMNRKKKQLELEKELLASEVETNNRIKKIQNEESNKITLSRYKTNFLQELEMILNERTANIESILKMKTSEEAIHAGGVSLHEMQLLVREATERCKGAGVNYEFTQQRIVTEKGLDPVVRVRDKDRMMETLWSSIQFLDWLHKLRDYDIEDSIRVLQQEECKWDVYEDTEVFEDSLNMSRISINITPVKKQLNESLQQLTLDMSWLDNTSDSTIFQQRDNINACLVQIELAAKTLAKLCHQYETREVSGLVTQAVDKVQCIMTGVKSTIHGAINSNSTVQTINSDTTVIEKQANSIVVDSPMKSNLRNLQNNNAQKNVRFN